MEHQKGNAVVVVLVIAVIALAAYVACNQGYIGGARDNQQDIEINLPDGSPSGNGSGY
jgi:hypothetical protein